MPGGNGFFNQFVDKGLLDRLQSIINQNLLRLLMGEAVKLLQVAAQPFEYPVEWGSDLQTEHERYLTEQVYKRPVFVTDYPRDIKLSHAAE